MARRRDPAGQPLEAVQRVERLVAGSPLPAAAAARARLVCATLRAAIPRCSSLGPGSTAAYSVVTTATDYVPDAIEQYLRLPPEWAVRETLGDGRTSLMVLCDALDLLTMATGDTLEAMVRADAQALETHDRFVRDRFGRGGGLLDLGR